MTMEPDIEEPDLDELFELELVDELNADDDLSDLLDGIEEDDYQPEPWESLEELAEEESATFDYYRQSGIAWDDLDE